MTYGKQYDNGDVVRALESIETKLSNMNKNRFIEEIIGLRREVDKIKNDVSAMRFILGDIHTTLKFIESNTDKHN